MPAERREIQVAYLTEDRVSVSDLAKRFGRTRETIAGLLKGEDFDALDAQLHEEAIKRARTGLRRNAVKAAQAWAETSVDAASQRGDHRPTRELLETIGAVVRHEGRSECGERAQRLKRNANDGTGLALRAILLH